VNTKVQLSAQKVVDFCKVADIEDSGKRVYCRCWKSATFPLCDGSHAKHNAETGDNVGPLIVQK
jgi:CDGSH-type Zn-finger protein